jgi:lipopolysaccharide export system protein LptA
MFARRRDQFVHYEGHVRAWHGADVIESPSLDYYGLERRLSSGSQVLTSHLAPALRPPTSSGARTAHGPLTQPLTVRADHLEYLEAIHEASYRGNVQLQSQGATLKADRMDVLFAQGPALQGLQIDNVVADGHVILTEPGRRATGEHGTYFADSGRVVLRGGPPMLYDEQRGSTTGQSLTFFIHDDTLSVDGGDQSPALSKRRMLP